MARIGYARVVSTQNDQHPQAQADLLTARGLRRDLH